MKTRLSLFITLIFCSLTCLAAGSRAKLNVAVDFESARVITALLSKKSVSPVQIDKVAATYGSKQLIEKVKGYSGAGEDVFKNTLREIIETGTVKNNDPYNWKEVKANLPAINVLLKKLSASPDAFINDIKAKISVYTGNNIDADITACFLVGGGSLGFTLGDGMTFNVALQKIGSDYDGLKLLVAHELYHSIQEAGQSLRKPVKSDMPYYIKASYALLYNLWSEGTASLVGDFTGMKNPMPFAKTQLNEIEKNAGRKGENVTLFEALLYKCYRDTASKRYNALYSVGFSTAYDETSYFVGYEMSKKIEQYQGKQAIADLLTQDLLTFADTYIKLYKMHPDDKTFIRFDKSTEAIVVELAPWRDKI